MKYNVCWDIINKCNDNCLFCYRDKDCKELSYTEKQKVLQKIYDSNVVRKLTITGGEPLLYQDLFKLLNSVNKPIKLQLALVTNGICLADYDSNTNSFKINEELLNQVLKTFSWISFSLDSYNEQYDTKTRNPLHFKRIKFILDYISKHKLNINIKINTLVSKQNYQNVEKIHNLISNYPMIKRWKLFRYVSNSNSSVKTDEYFNISDKAFEEVKNYIKELESNIKEILFLDNTCYEKCYISVKADGVIRVLKDSEYLDVCDLDKESIMDFVDSPFFSKQLHRENHFLTDES